MAKKTVKKAVKKERGQDGQGAKNHGQDGRATGGRAAGRRSAVVDTRVVFCGDNLDQLRRLPEGCVESK